MLYADYAATAPLLDCAREAMEPFLRETFANPSALYRAGAQARRALEMARWEIADLLGCQPSEIYFTSGGSEGNSWAAWNGALFRPRGNGGIVTSAIEHHSLLRACETLGAIGTPTRILPVTSTGMVSTDTLQTALKAHPTLVSIQYANNEVGTVQDIPVLGDLCHRAGALFHTDAVQAVGHIPLELTEVDLLTASAHKFGGPKGIGFLYVRRGIHLRPLIYGGGQEQGVRGGTENVAAVAGMAAALAWTMAHRADTARRLEEVEHSFSAALREGCPQAVFHSVGTPKLPGLVSVALPGIGAEQLVYRLDTAGICVSAGAACDQRGAKQPSHVLLAMGVPTKLANSTIRVSFGPGSRPEEGRTVAEALIQLARQDGQ